jgi:hypothetical protein
MSQVCAQGGSAQCVRLHLAVAPRFQSAVLIHATFIDRSNHLFVANRLKSPRQKRRSIWGMVGIHNSSNRFDTKAVTALKRFVETASALRNTFAKNPHRKVLVCAGF